MDTKFDNNKEDYISSNFIEVLDKMFGNLKKPIELHEPLLNAKENKYVTECINSNYVSSVGKFVDKFENLISEFTGSAYTVAVVNGTVALKVGLHLLGVKRDEVMKY